MCLGLFAAGIYLALLAPVQPPFERVDGRVLEVNTSNVTTPAGPDKLRKLVLTGAACLDYDYLDSWAKRVGLPVFTDLNATEPVTVYTDPRSCAGLNVGASAPLRAIVYKGRLYATDAYLHPPNERLANLPAALLLLLIGAAGIFLLIHRALASAPPATLN